MMKIAIITALVASASAFAPSQTAKSSALSASFSEEIGAQMPLKFWDPCNILETADQAEFDRLRWVELKHGRVAMLAVVGYLTTYAGVRFPGAESMPSGFAAIKEMPPLVFAQMCFTWALMEAANSNAPGEANGFTPEFQGDFRNGKLDFGWDKQTDAWKRRKRSIELNNGRAAQMGILGLMVHEQMGNVDVLLPLANK